MRLSGSGTLVVGGYRLADGSFTFSNFPADAGLFANVRIAAGSVLNATGRLTIVGDRYYLGVSANLDLKVTTVQGSVIFTNCSDPSCRTGKGATTLDASATLTRDKFSFGISVRVSSNGSFSATASSPVTGEFRGRTGDVTILAVAFYADFHYHMTLTVTSSSPYIASAARAAAACTARAGAIAAAGAGAGPAGATSSGSTPRSRPTRSRSAAE